MSITTGSVVVPTPPAKVPVAPMTWHRDALPLLICVVLGFLVSTLPHWIELARGHGMGWVSSYDEAHSYLPLAGNSFHDHPLRLTDPMLRDGGHSMFPGMQLLPGIWLAKLLGLPPEGIALMWRLLAGVTVPLALYPLLRQFVNSAWMAAAVCLIFLFDFGTMNNGRPLDRHFTVLLEIARGKGEGWFTSWPVLLHQWRIMTPALSWGYLFVFLWLYLRARECPTWFRIGLSAIAYGILYYAYFYFWTAASAMLAACWLFEPQFRRATFFTGLLGGIIGLPSLLEGARLKREFGLDCLHRVDKFVPIPRFSEFIAPPLATGLLVVLVIWVVWRRRDLFPLAMLALAGFALMNSQVITGMQLENNHWAYVWSPLQSLLVGLIAVGLIEHWRPRWPLLGLALGGLALLVVVTGFMLRWWEVTRSKQAVELTATWRQYVEQRRAPGTVALEPRAVVGGDIGFSAHATIGENSRSIMIPAFLSMSVNNEELWERMALNAWLLDLSEAELAEAWNQELGKSHNGPAGRDRALRRAQFEAVRAAFRRTAAAPDETLKRFEVAYVALPAGAPQPAYLRAGWKRLQDGPHWQLWQRAAN